MVRFLAAKSSFSALLLLAIAQLAHAQDGVGLRLATWNMAWLLDFAPRSPEMPRRGHSEAADVAIARAYVERMRADIVAFQEIDNTKSAARIFDARTYDLHTTSETEHRIAGFAVRRGLRFDRNADVGGPGILAEQRPSLWQFADITVYPGERKFRLLTVQLSSECKARNLHADDESCVLLRRQSAAIAGWIAARLNTLTPFIVLGDFGRALDDDDGVWGIITLGRSARLSRTAAGLMLPCRKHGNGRNAEQVIFGGDARHWIARRAVAVVGESASTVLDQKRIGDRCPCSIDLAIR